VETGRNAPQRTVRSAYLAPQSGHVSNLCHPVGPVIELVDGHCFQSDPRELLARVHGGHPVWTRLELAREPRLTSGYAVIQDLIRAYMANRDARAALTQTECGACTDWTI
jgi:hypothetical protein